MAENKQIVWTTKLDGKYKATVYRTGEYTGMLTLTGGHGDPVLCEAVSLLHGAEFGPDVEDVAAWKRRVVEFVDGMRGGLSD